MGKISKCSNCGEEMTKVKQSSNTYVCTNCGNKKVVRKTVKPKDVNDEVLENRDQEYLISLMRKNYDRDELYNEAREYCKKFPSDPTGVCALTIVALSKAHSGNAVLDYLKQFEKSIRKETNKTLQSTLKDCLKGKVENYIKEHFDCRYGTKYKEFGHNYFESIDGVWIKCLDIYFDIFDEYDKDICWISCYMKMFIKGIPHWRALSISWSDINRDLKKYISVENDEHLKKNRVKYCRLSKIRYYSLIASVMFGVVSLISLKFASTTTLSFVFIGLLFVAAIVAVWAHCRKSSINTKI